MHVARLRLRDFRNYARLDVDFPPGFHLLIGKNAQGKTNVLEAIYLLATYRSFRSAGNALMVRSGTAGYFVGAEVAGRTRQKIRMYWSPGERRLSVDDQPIRKLADYYGTLRAVVFCTEDLQLVKGPAARRRRFLDLLLAQTDPGYLALLRRYTVALRSRNAILKQRSAATATLESFSTELVLAGTVLMERRAALAPRLSGLARLAYRRIIPDQEEFQAAYLPSVHGDFTVELAQSKNRERAYRSTVVGPHRDELDLTLDGKSAAQFASEGQKRSIALALKLAQAEYLTGLHGSPPVLLIDDVMGELDASRRGGFLPLLQKAKFAQGQVFMTVTEQNWPRDLGLDVVRWNVAAGDLEQAAEG